MDNDHLPPDNNGQLSPADNGNGNGDAPQLRDLNDVLRQQIGRTSLRRRKQLLDAMETIVQAYSVGRDDDISFIVEQYISIREHNIKLQRRIDKYEKKERNSTGASTSSSNMVISILDNDEEVTPSTTVFPSSAPLNAPTSTGTNSGASIDKSEMLIQHLRAELFKANTQIASATIDSKSLQAERFSLATRLNSAEKEISALQSKHIEERTNLANRASVLQQQLVGMKNTTDLQLRSAWTLIKKLKTENEALTKELGKAGLVVANQAASNPTAPATTNNPSFASSLVASALPITTPVSGSHFTVPPTSLATSPTSPLGVTLPPTSFKASTPQEQQQQQQHPNRQYQASSASQSVQTHVGPQQQILVNQASLQQQLLHHQLQALTTTQANQTQIQQHAPQQQQSIRQHMTLPFQQALQQQRQQRQQGQQRLQQ
ncbi:hypothetical protein BGZ92_009680, partial [Podila epicladia]